VPVTRVDVLEASASSLRRRKPIDSRMTSSSATAAYASVLARLPLLGCARSRNVSPRLPAERYELQEHTFPLPNSEILTLLTFTGAEMMEERDTSWAYRRR
jgi:hypothetical protein